MILMTAAAAAVAAAAATAAAAAAAADDDDDDGDGIDIGLIENTICTKRLGMVVVESLSQIW